MLESYIIEECTFVELPWRDKQVPLHTVAAMQTTSLKFGTVKLILHCSIGLPHLLHMKLILPMAIAFLIVF